MLTIQDKVIFCVKIFIVSSISYLYITKKIYLILFSDQPLIKNWLAARGNHGYIMQLTYTETIGVWTLFIATCKTTNIYIGNFATFNDPFGCHWGFVMCFRANSNWNQYFFLIFFSSSYRLENIIIALVGKIYHNFTFKVCSFHWCKIWIGFYYLAIYNQDFNSLEPLDMNKTGMEKRGLMVIHINYIPKISWYDLSSYKLFFSESIYFNIKIWVFSYIFTYRDQYSSKLAMTIQHS